MRKAVFLLSTELVSGPGPKILQGKSCIPSPPQADPSALEGTQAYSEVSTKMGVRNPRQGSEKDWWCQPFLPPLGYPTETTLLDLGRRTRTEVQGAAEMGNREKGAYMALLSPFLLPLLPAGS